MQIAGSKCKVCERNIVFSNEGKFCAHCGTVVHLACESQAQCGVCGQPFQQYEPPQADPLSEAILPPALRSAKSGAPTFAILMVVALAILLIVAYYALQAAWAHRP